MTPIVMATSGWPAAFYGFGAAAALWLPLWLPLRMPLRMGVGAKGDGTETEMENMGVGTLNPKPLNSIRKT